MKDAALFSVAIVAAVATDYRPAQKIKKITMQVCSHFL
jgi:hypothetical protein